MRILILALALIPAAAVADVVQQPEKCRVNAPTFTAGHPPADGFHRLDKLPPAHEFLTLYREVGHCPRPVVVADNVGRTQR